MTNKKTIFISYGRDQEHPEDVELVKKIKEDLSKEFNVLMDLDRLKQGDDWENKLSDDLAQSHWILFFITPYSARRPDGYCLNELSYALYKKKSIAPIMIEEEVLPLSICRIQYLDLQGLKKDPTEYNQKLQGLISVLNEEKELDFEGAYASLYSSLYPLQFKSVIAKHVHGFVGREWIYDKVDHWIKEETDSRVLWITAEAGYGKTALSVYLSEKHPSSISIHFCQHDYRESREPAQMLKVLIYELSTQIEEYGKELLGLDIKEKLAGSATNIFQELLIEPLIKIKPPEKNIFFIIDALDEAKDENGKNPIVELVSNRFDDLPSWLNIIITSRAEPELIRKLKKFNPMELKADEANNFSDLKLFIRKQIKEIDDLIVDVLIKKSEGNMLYLKSILESDNIKAGNFLLEDIENLPQGMEALYQQYFERKFEDIERYEEDYLLFVSILVSSGEGLDVELIKGILDLSDREYMKIISTFGSLIETNDDIVTFYHKSLFDWLSYYEKSGVYSADMQKGHHLIYDYFKQDIQNKNYHKNFNIIIHVLAYLGHIDEMIEYFNSRDYRDKESLLNFLVKNEEINPLTVLTFFENNENLESVIIDELYKIAYATINDGIFDLNIVRRVLSYFEIHLEKNYKWFYMFLDKISGNPFKLDGFFKSSASDWNSNLALDYNPAKMHIYLLIMDIIEKIKGYNHPIPAEVHKFLKKLKVASLYFQGKFEPYGYMRNYGNRIGKIENIF